MPSPRGSSQRTTASHLGRILLLDLSADCCEDLGRSRAGWRALDGFESLCPSCVRLRDQVNSPVASDSSYWCRRRKRLQMQRLRQLATAQGRGQGARDRTALLRSASGHLVGYAGSPNGLCILTSGTAGGRKERRSAINAAGRSTQPEKEEVADVPRGPPARIQAQTARHSRSVGNKPVKAAAQADREDRGKQSVHPAKQASLRILASLLFGLDLCQHRHCRRDASGTRER